MTEMEMSFTDKELEEFARRLLPEIKKYFHDEEVQKEFQKWKEGRGVKT